MVSVVEQRDLLARARTGDQHAFATLIGEHRRQVWGVCLRITGNQWDAEDALQDCLTAAWHHLASFRGDAAFSTWLYRIAANAATAVARRRIPVPAEIPDAPAAGTDLGQRVADQDAVNRALAALPVTFRTAVVLREICGFSYEEIAQHEAINIQTVKSRINRGRSMLRQALNPAALG